MDNIIFKRLAHLISVKSIVTLFLTAIFGYQIVKQTVSQEFMQIYITVIAFYFGTQSQKIQDAIGGVSNEDKN